MAQAVLVCLASIDDGKIFFFSAQFKFLFRVVNDDSNRLNRVPPLYMASFLGGAPATDSLDLEVAAASSRTAGRSSLKARGSPSAAAMSRIIMERQSQSRRRVKAKILQQRAAAVKTAQRTKLAKERQWKKRMATSPFAVDLVAETERIDEENRVRLRQERRRARQAEQRKQSLKNTIIRKALTEETDLDTLRMEKRAIIDEERRLKALLDLEKASAKRKQDLLVSVCEIADAGRSRAMLVLVLALTLQSLRHRARAHTPPLIPLRLPLFSLPHRPRSVLSGSARRRSRSFCAESAWSGLRACSRRSARCFRSYSTCRSLQITACASVRASLASLEELDEKLNVGEAWQVVDYS